MSYCSSSSKIVFILVSTVILSLFLSEAHLLSQPKGVLRSVSALRRARTGTLNASIALTEFLLVTSAEAEDTAPAIELVTNVLVHLAEFVKLSCDIIILDLHNLGVLLKGILFSEVVNILSTKSSVSYLGLFEILALEEQLIFAILVAGLELAYLSSQVEVASSSEFILLAKFVIVC